MASGRRMITGVAMDGYTYLEFHSGPGFKRRGETSSHKYYFCFHVGSKVCVVYGRIPGYGRAGTAQFNAWDAWSGPEARKLHDSHVASKLNKGYERMGSPSVTLSLIRQGITENADVFEDETRRLVRERTTERTSASRSSARTRKGSSAKTPSAPASGSRTRDPVEIGAGAYFKGRRIKLED